MKYSAQKWQEKVGLVPADSSETLAVRLGVLDKVRSRE